MNKKGVIDQLGPIVISLVVIAMVMVVGFLIINEVKTGVDDDQKCGGGVWNSTTEACNDASDPTVATGKSYMYNGTESTESALEGIPQWLPIVVITLIGVLLIGLVSLFRRRM